MNATMSTRRLICYVDLPAESVGALRIGAALAETQGAQLHILQILPADGPAGGSRQPSAEEIQAVVSRLQSGGMDAAAIEESGDAEDVVRRYIQRYTPHLLVTAKDARRNRKWLGLESVAIDDVYRANCPSLVVSRDPSSALASAPFGFTQIVCAVDLSTGWVSAVEQAGGLAHPNGARVTLLHVMDRYPGQPVYSGARALRLVEEYRSLVDNMAGQLRKAASGALPPAVILETRVVTGTPNGGILDTAMEAGADLIVLGIRPERILDRILFGSTSRSVIRRAECSVLTVPLPSSDHTSSDDDA